MEELDKILQFIYNHINNDIIKVLKEEYNDVTILSVQIISYSDVNDINTVSLEGYYDIISSIDFDLRYKKITYNNIKYIECSRIHILDEDLFDKWYEIFDNYYKNNISNILKKSFEVTLKNSTVLSRDYKLNYIR